MYEIFGEFDTYNEINKTAEGLRDEGDSENLFVLAKENGIDKEIAQMFIDRAIDILCDAESAAYGKIEAEVADLKAEGIMIDWAEYIKGCIVNDGVIAAAVRKKGKSLKGCIAELLKESFKSAKSVDKDICKLAGVPSNCKLGMPGMSRAKEIIKAYYLGK